MKPAMNDLHGDDPDRHAPEARPANKSADTGQRLQLSEEALRLATSAGEVGLWDVDLRTGTLNWCARTRAMFGIFADQACTMADFYAGLHPDDRDATTQAFSAAIDPATRLIYDVEYRTIGHDDGQLRWVAAKGRGLFDETGRCVRALGTAIDITGRKNDQQLMVANEARLAHSEDALRRMNETLEALVAERTGELRASQARLRTIFETSHQLQALVSLDGTLLDANATSLMVSGSTLEEVVGRPFWEGPWFAQTEGAPGMIRQAIMDAAAGRTTRNEFSLNLPAGHRTYEFSVRPIHNRDGAVFAIVPDAMDITERRQAEEALRQSQKMEAFGQLTGGVAHDFNNLLQAISGGLEMLARKYVHSEDGHRLIRLVTGAADRGAQLTRQLLAFARHQRLESKATDVNETVASSGQLLERSLGGELTIERRLGQGVWPAMADPSQLDIAVLNLVINARDAMPQGGTIVISTENVVAPAAETPPDLAPGCYVRLAVTDTGCGMTADVRERVFEPFFTTKGVGKGTGLGLSQVYGFAHQSSGTVRIISAPGQGTTVEIFLPRAEAEDVALPDEGEPTQWRGRETVLVVDDDNDVRELAAASLAELGYRVLSAESGAAGLEVIGHEPSIDLLLADFAMPGMNGAELVRLARRVRPQLRVLFMSGYADLDAVLQHAGPDGILYKPFKMADLATRIGATLVRSVPARIP